MSKQIPLLDPTDRDVLRHLISDVTAAEKYARSIAVIDPFNLSSSAAVSTAIDALIDRDRVAAQQKAKLDDLVEQIRVADSPHFSAGGDYPSDLDELLTGDRLSHGDTGYLLGLLVGLRLGPAYLDVFRELKGGAK